jgi:capsular polysaccharide biosynthesis protein
LLPETYRHFLYPHLVNHVTTEIAPRFAQVRLGEHEPTQLSGSYFHFDSEWPGHYGHVLSEQMSRLWGWEAAKARHPDLKVLLGKRPGASGVQPFEAAILEAVGVPSNDIMLVGGPVRVERLVAATPMFSMPDYVSPRITPIWNVVGLTVGAQADGRPLPKRFFCGRNKETRLCLNSEAVEEVFAQAGFEILYPADLPFSSQVALFQQAEVVAGYVGSALFTLCFCAKPKRVLMVSSWCPPSRTKAAMSTLSLPCSVMRWMCFGPRRTDQSRIPTTTSTLNVRDTACARFCHTSLNTAQTSAVRPRVLRWGRGR